MADDLMQIVMECFNAACADGRGNRHIINDQGERVELADLRRGVVLADGKPLVEGSDRCPRCGEQMREVEA